jgi:hypothetical protein
MNILSRPKHIAEPWTHGCTPPVPDWTGEYKHPFEGKSLAVWQSIRRKGRMYLVLILPDGSKSMIPAEWTDFALPTQPERAPAAPRAQTLGSLEGVVCRGFL